MTNPSRDLSDAELDRLLALVPAARRPLGMTDRIVAEATRAGRIRGLPAAGAPRRRARAWTRPRTLIGIIALNLMVASAIAAAFGGGHFALTRIAAISARIFHSVPHIAPVHVRRALSARASHGAPSAPLSVSPGSPPTRVGMLSLAQPVPASRTSVTGGRRSNVDSAGLRLDRRHAFRPLRLRVETRAAGVAHRWHANRTAGPIIAGHLSPPPAGKGHVGHAGEGRKPLLRGFVPAVRRPDEGEGRDRQPDRAGWQRDAQPHYPDLNGSEHRADDAGARLGADRPGGFAASQWTQGRQAERGDRAGPRRGGWVRGGPRMHPRAGRRL